jgi:hypothetical protein
MASRKIQGKERKRIPLASIARKRGMMRTIVGNCIPRRDSKWFKEKKGGKQVATTTRPIDLGSDSGDESKVSLVGMTGKIGEGFYCRSKLFHIRVIMRHTNFDTLIDSGSQSNLISEEVVNKLGLKTQMHHKPYTLK